LGEIHLKDSAAEPGKVGLGDAAHGRGLPAEIQQLRSSTFRVWGSPVLEAVLVPTGGSAVLERLIRLFHL
jgi:hypothetical protein